MSSRKIHRCIEDEDGDALPITACECNDGFPVSWSETNVPKDDADGLAAGARVCPEYRMLCVEASIVVLRIVLYGCDTKADSLLLNVCECNDGFPMSDADCVFLFVSFALQCRKNLKRMADFGHGACGCQHTLG